MTDTEKYFTVKFLLIKIIMQKTNVFCRDGVSVVLVAGCLNGEVLGRSCEHTQCYYVI